MNVIRTGLGPSRRSPGFVHRARLDRHIDDVLAHRVTLLQAPAGAGKTGLLAQWHDILASQGVRVIWLTLDRHLGNFIGHLISGCEQSSSEFASEFSARLTWAGDSDESFRTSESELSALVEVLAAYKRRICIIVDDAQFIPAAEATLFQRFVARIPENANLILASRTRPDLPLSRMAAQGDLFEFGQAHLRFTRAEVGELLEANGQSDLDESQISDLHVRTEGWATGLRLAVLSMAGQPDRARFVASFSGSKQVVADFFSEDVVASLPEDMQRFLLAMCFLDRFCAELCDAVTGGCDGEEMIGRVEAAGLFLVRLDDEMRWYRFHSLFAGFLMRRATSIEPEAAAEVHRRAARWYFERHMRVEALDHARQSKDASLLAELLEQCCEEIVYEGRLYYVFELAEQIGRPVLDDYPAILLSSAWHQIRGLQFHGALLSVDRAEQVLDQRRVPDDAPIRDLVLHRRLMLAAAQDRFEEVETMCAQLLSRKDRLHPYLLCNLYGQTIRAQRGRLRFEQFERYEALARQVLTSSGFKFAFVAQQAIVGRTYFAQGRSAAAERALSFGLEQAIDFAGRGSSLAALPALPLAQVFYDRNELQRARALLDAHMAVARRYAFSDELLDGLILKPRLASAAGNFEEAIEALDDAHSVAAELDLPQMLEAVRAERVKTLLRHFHVDRALLLENAPEVPTEAFRPDLHSTVVEQFRAATRVRLDIASGRLDEAPSLAQRWRSFARNRGATRDFIEWSLLHAQGAWMEGDRRLAQRSLRDALVASGEARCLRLFLDEGVRIRDVLAEAYGAGPRTDLPVDKLAYEILDLFECGRAWQVHDIEDEGEPALDGKVTGRELEILAFVAAGLRNREIGDRLGLTEGSVKWYMQRIYDKVGTRRRSLAVERARQFGFLS